MQQCPKCSSTDIVKGKTVGAIKIAFLPEIYLNKAFKNPYVVQTWTYTCSSCGYIESYADTSQMKKRPDNAAGGALG